MSSNELSRINAPSILRPDHVQGALPIAQRRPDRLFYVLYGDTVWELDGYRVGPREQPDDGPDVCWTIHLACPRCHQNLLLDSLKKHLKVHPGQGLEAEPLHCSYRAEFGGPCPFGVALDLPSKRSDREVLVNGQRLLIDAVARNM